MGRPGGLMKKYTVVLLRPHYLCNRVDGEKYGTNIYVATRIVAANTVDAVRMAKAEVYSRDRKEIPKPHAPSDYELCVAFEGHHDPVLFGWQPH